MTVCVISLGCPKNLVDSEHMLGYLARAGFQLSSVPEESDVLVVNTCGFLKSAVDEAEAAIRRSLEYKRTGSAQRVIVAGCLVQRYGERLKALMPDVDAWIGIDQAMDLPRIIRQGSPAEALVPTHLCSAVTPRLVSTPAHYAYLRIADGCDNWCSYCLIPSIRGRFRSRPIEDVTREAKLLAKGGARELILIAQDTTLYGQDQCGRKMLAPLLRRLAAVPGVEWVRIMYTHPAHFTSEMIDEIASNPAVVKYVDLPLQHISNRLLKQMNRPYQQADVEALLSRLHAIPGMAIRTTMITGFPGETESEFQELMDFVAEGRFTHLGCFAFSPEPGAAAYRMPGQLPPKVGEERAREVMRVQRRVALRRNRALVGKTLKVVIDTAGKSAHECLGRTAADAPEIDNTVHVFGASRPTGELITVRVTRAGAYDLCAEAK
jgi:ribosomal protein S12 methylthiotransferase